MNKGWRMDFVFCCHVNFRNHTSQSFQTLLSGWPDHTCRYNQSSLYENQLLLSCTAPASTSSQDCAAICHFWQKLSSHILPLQCASSSPASPGSLIPLSPHVRLCELPVQGKSSGSSEGWGCLSGRLAARKGLGGE